MRVYNLQSLDEAEESPTATTHVLVEDTNEEGYLCRDCDEQADSLINFKNFEGETTVEEYFCDSHIYKALVGYLDPVWTEPYN